MSLGPAYLNQVMFTCASAPGTGPLVVGAAAFGSWRTPATAGIPDGTQVPYTAFVGSSQVEYGVGTYHASTTRITRDTPDSGSSTPPVNFTSAPTVWLGGAQGLAGDTWMDFLAAPSVAALTFAHLPVNPPNGTDRYITDGPASPTYLQQVTVGGGTTSLWVFFNSSVPGWFAH